MLSSSLALLDVCTYIYGIILKQEDMLEIAFLLYVWYIRW